MTNALDKAEIQEVKKQANEKLKLCKKEYDIIGNQVFAILGLHSRVIYYPLGENAPWGFTRISGSRNDILSEKPFVAINTSIPIDCQVFAAAHELYHIWYKQTPDVLSADLLNESNREKDEMKANRFAAEFLVKEQLLRQEIGLRKIKDFTIKEVLCLSELFAIPYEAMAKRLREIDIIDDDNLNKFLGEEISSINNYRKKYSIFIPEPNNRIVLDNLVELATDAYEQGYITYAKLEYLLGMSNLSPEELGIKNEVSYKFPSSDELDSIMEE